MAMAPPVEIQFERGAGGAAEVGKERVDDPVPGPVAVAAGSDQTGPREAGELAGDVRLALAGGADQVADATFAPGEMVEQVEPHGVGERPEAGGEGREQRSGDRIRHSRM